jgi:hypothetical protein
MERLICPHCSEIVDESQAKWNQAIATGKCPFCKRAYDIAGEQRRNHVSKDPGAHSDRSPSRQAGVARSEPGLTSLFLLLIVAVAALSGLGRLIAGSLSSGGGAGLYGLYSQIAAANQRARIIATFDILALVVALVGVAGLLRALVLLRGIARLKSLAFVLSLTFLFAIAWSILARALAKWGLLDPRTSNYLALGTPLSAITGALTGRRLSHRWDPTLSA